MALLKDEGGDDFIRPFAYPKAAERACEALLSYLRAQHDREEAEVRRATSGHLHPLYHDRHWLLSEHDVSYSLSTHPMEYPQLARLNWSHERPRLDVHISIEHHRSPSVNLVVSPAAETIQHQHVKAGWYGMMIEQGSTDFQSFRGGHYGHEVGPLKLVGISVDSSLLMSFREPEPADNSTYAKRLRFARETLFHAVHHKLHQLSMHFNCRLVTRLVMYGPNHTLETRHTTRGERRYATQASPAVDVVKPSVLDASGWTSELIQGFIARHPGSEGWLRNFVETRRDTHSIETLREELADYLEIPRHQVDPELVEALVAATDGAAFADEALRRLHNADNLKAFIQEGHRPAYSSDRTTSWLNRAASATRRDKWALLPWLLDAHPAVMLNEGAAAMSAEAIFALALDLDKHWVAKQVSLSAGARATMDSMLAQKTRTLIPTHSRKDVVPSQKPLAQTNQRVLYRLAGCSSWAQLISWAGAAWPELASELATLKVAGSATPAPTSLPPTPPEPGIEQPR